MSKYEIDSDYEGGLPFKCYICRESFKQPVITKSVCCRGGIEWLRQDFSGEATANYTLRHVNAMHKIARPTNNWGEGGTSPSPWRDHCRHTVTSCYSVTTSICILVRSIVVECIPPYTHPVLFRKRFGVCSYKTSRAHVNLVITSSMSYFLTTCHDVQRPIRSC